MKLRKLLSLVLAAVMLMGCMTVTAFADGNEATLDLETGDTNLASKEIEQNYTFTQASEEYTDVTKVKLTWTITDIAATYASNKTWDPDNLVWKETKTVADIADKTAEFTLTNYSSKKVVGTVSFKAETTLKDTLTSATFDENNGKTIDTVVNSDHSIDETKKANVPNNTITATLTFNKDKFADLTATTSATKYGTYTVTISALPTLTANYLSFTANIAGSTVTPKFKSGSYQYSTNNGKTWTDGDNSGTTIPLAKAGDSVLLKGNSCETDMEHHFTMSGSVSASGSVTSLTDGIGIDEKVTLTSNCYSYMFYGCTALTSAPSLPATTLAASCYISMFNGCTTLTSAPSLPATTLAGCDSCYSSMFSNCESLATAPSLPATTLAESCYDYMFEGCTKLTTAPNLPATTLTECCYEQMFKSCSILKITTIQPSGTIGTDYGIIINTGDITETADDPADGMFGGCNSDCAATPDFDDDKTYYWYK